MWKHTKAVTALAFAPDGGALVSGSTDTTVRAWDTATGNCVGVEDDLHTWGITAVAVSPDGTKVVSLAQGVNRPHKDHCRVALWNLVTGTRRTLALLEDISAACAAFSPDRRRLALKAGTVTLYDVREGEQVGELPIAARGYALAFSPDGKYLAVGHYDGPIHLWDVAKKKDVRTLTGHTGLVSCLAFSPDGKVLASASVTRTPRGRLDQLIRPNADHAIRFWSFPSGKPKGKAVEVGESAAHLTVLGDGSWVSFEADGKGTARRGKVGSPDGVVTWTPGRGKVRVAAVSPGGEWIATGDESGMILVWQLDAVLPP